ncbi:MAG: E3 ubiquitin protein ligase, partial [Candidatus Heimdallarchaeota archaeon]|nr:E3 ubiquitin protein ligase [Candidatus Heimdallarchaeota archaeon]MCK4253608.1 E3 ubiquitin protein ligase [Candidatus Heimdallarchaeota archaeon]
IGEEESKDLRSRQKVTYGDLGLKVDSIITYTIDEYIAEVEGELKKEVLEDEERSEKTNHILFATNINVSLQSLDISNIKIQEINNELILSFDSLNHNKYPFFLQFFIKYAQDGSIVLDGLFKKIQPFKVSIRSFRDEVNKEDQESFEDLNSHYIMSSNDDLLVKSLNQNSRITQKLIALSSNLELIMVNRKYFVVTFYDTGNLTKILDLLGELYKEFVNQQTGLKTVTYIKCFDCGENLDENDEKCPNCNANRPRCAICLLDLQPAEKEEVIQMPCCGVYGHREHIMIWVEKSHTCPNCRAKQIEWLDELNRLV